MLAQAADSEKGLKRTLGAGALVALGIGAIIGAGLFVRTAAAAGGHAGSAVTISFIIAAIGCAFAGLCYAEFASMIPIAGSAYTYAYTTMGELVAWIIGWALIAEYALGAATVSIAWSEFLNKLLNGAIPYEWSHSPFQKNLDADGVMHYGTECTRFNNIIIVISFVNQRHTGIRDSKWYYCYYKSGNCTSLYRNRMELYQSSQSHSVYDTRRCPSGNTSGWHFLQLCGYIPAWMGRRTARRSDCVLCFYWL